MKNLSTTMLINKILVVNDCFFYVITFVHELLEFSIFYLCISLNVQFSEDVIW